MEAIEFLIELDFDNQQSTQSTNIVVNQGNRNSVIFHFKVLKGANEINYADYEIAEVAFEKRNKALVIEQAAMDSNGISYTLHESVIDAPGIVTGQVMLSKSGVTAVTLYYNFKVVADITSKARSGGSYVGILEQLFAEFKEYIESFKSDATDLLSETETSTNEWIDRLREEFERQHAAMEDIVAGDFVINSLFNSHRANGDNNSQHLVRQGESYLLPNGKTVLADATERVTSILQHNLNRYPIVQVMQSGYGAGRGGAGAIPAGGNNISALFRYSFLDSNRLEIYLPIKLDNPQIQKIDDMNYILRSDSVAYQIFLT